MLKNIAEAGVGVFGRGIGFHIKRGQGGGVSVLARFGTRGGEKMLH